MREPPRRRRMSDESNGGGLPLFPLILVVVLAGLLLGGVLAHFLGGSNARSAASPVPVAVAPTPLSTPYSLLVPTSPSPRRHETPTPLPSATPTPLASASPTTTPAIRPSPKIVATPKPVATPHTNLERVAVKATPATVVATATPAVAHVATPTPAPVPKPARAAPAVVAGDDRAAGVVRSYLEALARGDRSAAAGFLASGAPSETFMNAGSRIESIHSANVGAEQYKVTADVQTGSGEYYVTFTLVAGPGGLQITDHYAIKPQ
jgi:hypothetical protein